jgi:hypothetical protein
MNPHGSRHSPRSQTGCTLFVRLRQYPGDENATRFLVVFKVAQELPLVGAPK